MTDSLAAADVHVRPRRTAIASAIVSAALFGVSAPASKALVGLIDPWMLAGLLYAGSGACLGIILLVRAVFARRVPREPHLSARQLPWLLLAIGAGGVAGPVLLMFGLARGSATEAALLLNLEGVFTALLAWGVFREHLDRRLAAGMVAIAAGALVLAWDPSTGYRTSWSALLVAGACLAWAVDNNLTRKIATADPVEIVALKGGLAGATSITIALVQESPWPPLRTVVAAASVGALSYGISLVLYILALRELGAARAGAYFSTAPFLGALFGVVGLREPVTTGLLIAALLMAIGVWLHVTERHEHDHAHAPTTHEHRHRHDEHHRHAETTDAGPEPHSHWHDHAALSHRHRHYPDPHHRHGHSGP
jgi:drug/metabolite transporter (DMT)-like permease